MDALHYGIFWYKDEATYLRFREIIEDKAQILCPYLTWVDLTQKHIDAIAKQGMFLVKINADPDEFIQWCKINSRALDESARIGFAQGKVRNMFGRG